MDGKEPEHPGYEPRFYRDLLQGSHVWNIRYQASDLWISAGSDCKDLSITVLRRVRTELDRYCNVDPAFTGAMIPYSVPDDVPPLIRWMADAGRVAGVGPLAAVAGAVAETVGRQLVAQCGGNIVIENGGDLFLYGTVRPRVAVLVRPENPFYGRLYLQAPDCGRGYGICTSSGTIGHSLSTGKAEAVVVQAPDAALADAAATAVANRIRSPDDIDTALRFGSGIPRVEGVLAVVEDRCGAWGNISLVS